MTRATSIATTRLPAVIAAAAVTIALAPRASAQTLYRRPFSSDTAPITAHFDTNGPGGGLADYVCGGRTYDGHTGTDFGIPEHRCSRQRRDA